MNSITWAEAFEKLIEAKGINPKPGRRWDSNSATVATLAKEVGVTAPSAKPAKRAMRLNANAAACC